MRPRRGKLVETSVFGENYIKLVQFCVSPVLFVNVQGMDKRTRNGTRIAKGVPPATRIGQIFTDYFGFCQRHAERSAKIICIRVICVLFSEGCEHLLFFLNEGLYHLAGAVVMKLLGRRFHEISRGGNQGPRQPPVQGQLGAADCIDDYTCRVGRVPHF